MTELLLPILYTEVPDLDEGSGDEAVALIARTQYVKWSELRLVDESSEAYRQGVNALAKRLMEIAQGLEERPIVPPPSGEEDEPGLVEMMAEAEAALPRWQAATEEFAPLVEAIGDALERAGERAQQSDARGKGFAGRLVAITQLAHELEPPAARLREVGRSYASEVVNVDPGILTLIRAAETETVGDEEALRTYCELFTAIEEATDGVRAMVRSAEEVIEGLRTLESLSRVLRPPLRDVEDGLRGVIDAQAVLDEWARLIGETDIDCSRIAIGDA